MNGALTRIVGSVAINAPVGFVPRENFISDGQQADWPVIVASRRVAFLEDLVPFAGYAATALTLSARLAQLSGGSLNIIGGALRAASLCDVKSMRGRCAFNVSSR